ncbi:MAG: hypothetical protein ACRDQX_08315, partial [Pseudonocardiaceae bacterium]
MREFLDPSTDAWLQAFPSTTLSQPDDIIPTARLSPAPERTVHPQAGDPILNVTQETPGDNFDTGNLSVREYLNINQQMPPSKKAFYPDDPANRPYERLDIVNFITAVISIDEIPPVTCGARLDFSQAQRKLILRTNMARNNSRIISDDHTDEHQELSEQGAANFPEIDHIIPKSSGGSNFYSNARVVSWQLNNKVARVKPLSGLVDLGRLAPPPLSGNVADQAKVIVEQYIARLVNPLFAAANVIFWASTTYNTISPKLQKLIREELDGLRRENLLVLT